MTKQSTALVDYKAELAKEAAEIASRIQAPGGDVIRLNGKEFVLPDGTKGPGPLSMVVIEFAAGKSFHDRPYEKGQESPPACFSLGLEPKKLIPDATSPDKQHEECSGCPLNEWGSNGKGKACDDVRLLALVHPDADENTKPWIIKVSKTGVTPWDTYVGTLKTQFDKVPIEFITQIYFDPNLAYSSLRFGDPKPNPNIQNHFSLKKGARARLLTAPDVSQYKPYVAPAPKGKKKV